MPIISPVGRKSWSVRSVVLLIYVCLTLASLTTVYPILIMMSNSVATPVDQDEYTLAPKYLYDEQALFRTYVFDKYGHLNRLGARNKLIDFFNQHHRTAFFSWTDFELPAIEVEPDQRILVEDFLEFRKNAPQRYSIRGTERYTMGSG